MTSPAVFLLYSSCTVTQETELQDHVTRLARIKKKAGNVLKNSVHYLGLEEEKLK